MIDKNKIRKQINFIFEYAENEIKNFSDNIKINSDNIKINNNNILAASFAIACLGAINTILIVNDQNDKDKINEIKIMMECIYEKLVEIDTKNLKH